MEITVETTTTTSSATRFSSRKQIADAQPLISRVMLPASGDAPGAMRVERMTTGARTCSSWLSGAFFVASKSCH